ncbi:MAG: septum formation initiator family protein [Pseudomonadota bacterium]
MVMLTRHKRRSRRTLYLFRVSMFAFGLYFAYHAFHGDHGLFAFAEVEQRVVELEGELAELTERKQALEVRVRALHASALDGDLLDERARSNLALIADGERIILP